VTTFRSFSIDSAWNEFYWVLVLYMRWSALHMAISS
jgi:hypothetical protein